MSDLIAAISTAPVPAAIGILRLSGPGALEAVDRVFRAARGGPMAAAPDRKLVYGTLLDGQGSPIDQVLATVSRGPNSYTGEDTAELQCHGSPMVLTLGLEALCAAGARPAGPGEFTRRAFLNGRLDLPQAEAVGDLLEARTDAAVRTAAGQLGGALSRRVEAVYNGLVDLMAHFHAVLDYPDEDIDPLTQGQLSQTLTRSETALEALLATFRRGQLLRQGVPAVILGKPNAGKSSLLNALLGYDRAIVTDVAGTTRDTVEEKVQVGHVLLRLCDTAGLRDTGDAVERLGVQRTRDAARQAALALLVLDGSRPLTAEDEDAIATAAAVPRQLVIVNKTDLPAGVEPAALSQRFGQVYPLSAATGEGVDALCRAVEALYPAGRQAQGELLTNARQADAVARSLEAVRSARRALEDGMTPDVVLTDAEAALEALGELNGKRIREDLVQTIFSRFCVGK